MTIAICTTCGEFKHGAFKPCPACGVVPVEKDELALSMALTDHYLSNEELEELREAIRTGKTIVLPEEVKAQFEQLIGNNEVLRSLRIASEAGFLEQATGGRRRSSLHVELFDFAEEAFDLGHAFVDLRDRVNRECGTFWSLIRNLFRTVDYDAFLRAAQVLRDRAAQLRGQIDTFVSPSDDAEREFSRRLAFHVDALVRVTELTSRKFDFMARKAAGVRDRTTWKEWQEIIRDESAILEDCDSSGKALTRYYRQFR
jgi:hypothetical protein